MRNNKFHSGFTLIEILVSLVVFVIFVSVSSYGYISVMRSAQEGNMLRKTYSETRSFLVLLQEEATLKTIDYDYYSDFSHALSATGETSTLVLKSADGENRTMFDFVKEENDEMGGRFFYTKEVKRDGQWVVVDGFTEPKILHSADVNLKNVLFEINPLKSPEKNAAYDVYQFQPMVTVMVEFMNGKKVQTSYSSRVYGQK